MKVKSISCLVAFVFFSFLSFLKLKAAIPDDAKYKRKRVIADIYLSPRALARGNTYITTASGQDSIFLNPALLPTPKEGIYDKTYLLNPAFIASKRILTTIKEIKSIWTLISEGVKDKSEISKAIGPAMDTLEKWEKEPTSAYTSIFFGAFFRYFAFGLLTSATLDADSGLATVSANDESIRVNALINIAPSTSFSYPVLPVLSLGASLRYIFRFEADLIQEISMYDFLQSAKKTEGIGLKDITAFGYKPAFDLGLVYKPQLKLNPRFGLMFANIGNVNFEDKDGKVKFKMEPLRQNLGIGASIHPEVWEGVLSVSLDIRDLTGSYDTSFFSETYVGVDYLFKEMLGASIGLSQGYPSMGFYFTSDWFQIDFGFYTKERGLRVASKPDKKVFFKLTASI